MIEQIIIRLKKTGLFNKFDRTLKNFRYLNNNSTKYKSI